MVFYNLPHSAGKIALIFFFISFLLTAGSEARTMDVPGRLPEMMAEAATQRHIPDSAVEAMQKRPVFAYANDPAYWEKEVVENSWWLDFAGSPWVRLLIGTLLAAVLLFALYRIIVANKLYLFYRSSSRKPDGETELMGIAEERLDEKITQSMQAGDYRSAIRFMYLKALKMLDEKGWIQFNSRHTNRDYVTELNKRPEGADFGFITRNYEYVWYGEFIINKPGFDTLYQRFEQFYQAVQSTANKEKY